MVRLLIGNDWSEELEEPAGTGWAVQRLLWFARDGDVLVLPVPPEEEFLSYVTSLTGTRRDSLEVVVPPPGRTGTGALTADRLTDPAFVAELRKRTAGRPVDEVFALWPDAAVAAAADALGCPGALEGHAFLTQSGGLLGSSKAVFRALAAGVGAPSRSARSAAIRGAPRSTSPACSTTAPSSSSRTSAPAATATRSSAAPPTSTCAAPGPYAPSPTGRRSPRTSPSAGTG
ncbi:preATP grasp domain-containing protein [Streptomyces globosus]|uniref:preATP grasp domain-containing protein n=1 Tax=Streptomyces globosus TaxID=68209 RepID=UPI003636A485